MREIKFKIWDSNTKIMINGSRIIAWSDLFFKEGNNADGSYIPLQFTGLRDKNGREIYEGDICKHRTINDDGEFMDDWENTEIWFCEGQFLTRYYGFPVHSFCKKDKTEMEVIGNIWETPELLKEPSSQ